MPTARQLLIPFVLLAGCSGNAVPAEGQPVAVAASDRPFRVEPVAQFNEPWAMTFLPGGGEALITEKAGKLKLWRVSDNRIIDVGGVPRVSYGGQGGFGDVVLHPDFANNRLVYLSWVVDGEGGRLAVVGRARLQVNESTGVASLENVSPVWRQSDGHSDGGHFSHRIAFGPDGKLYISSGDRQNFTPAQDPNGNLGRIVRLNDDGSVPSDNPWASRGGVGAQAWTMGNRNPLGLAFAPDGRLWSNEMGPRGGDEFNRIERGANYGYPIVSNGDHYDGRPIPDHDTRPEFAAPQISWTPVISPSSMIFYTGTQFPEWRGNALIGSLGANGIVRVAIEGDTAREVARYDLGARIREVEQAPDGTVYVLEDSSRGAQGRLLKLTPSR